MRQWTLLLLVWALMAPEAHSKVPVGALIKLLEVGGKLVSSALGVASSDTSELLRRFDALTAAISRVEAEVSSVSRALGPLRSFDVAVGKQIDWGNTVETLEQLLENVHSKYDRFLFYQQNNGSIERWTLEDFAREAVSHSPHSAQSTMYSLRDLVLGGALRSSPRRGERRRRFTLKPGLFRQLRSVLQGSKTMVCGLEQSPQQSAYSLAVVLFAALGKIHSMVQFSYMLLRVLGKGTFTSEEEHYRAAFLVVLDAVSEESGSAVSRLPATFWRCDPARHVRGATYEEVTELLQGHIENEVDLSSWGTCKGVCSNYETVRTNRCYEPVCRRQRRCNGTLHDCRFIASGVTACIADGRRQPRRRYSWLQYCDGRLLGRKDDTTGGCSSKLQMSSWLRGFVHCSMCFCLCDDDTHSERYFSLLPAVADIAQNKMVTGVRFVKKSGVFYIQLEQGDADRAEYTQNATETEQWKVIDRYIDINRDTEGVDYLRLSYKKRSVLLKDLRAPPGRVVTGVSFDSVLDHLSLKIQVTAISADGVLSANSSIWVSDGGRSPAETRVKLGWNLPTEAGEPSWPDSRPGQTVTFSASSMDGDAAQTTLPLLDMQPVTPRPPSALDGVGLYHKGRPGSGGFLGLRVLQAFTG